MEGRQRTPPASSRVAHRRERARSRPPDQAPWGVKELHRTSGIGSLTRRLRGGATGCAEVGDHRLPDVHDPA